MNYPRVLSRLSFLVEANPRQGIVGIIVNPKTLEPYLATVSTFGNVQVFLNDGEMHGDADFQKIYRGPSKLIPFYCASADVTGYPRIHTAAGVEEPGTGQGTVLYAASACAARYVSPGVIYGTGKAGASSGPDRSDEADQWWKKATAKGFAQRIQEYMPLKELQKKYMFTDYEDETTVLDILKKSSNLEFNFLTQETVLKSGLVLTNRDGVMNKNTDLWLSLQMQRSGVWTKKLLLGAFKTLNPSNEQLDMFQKNMEKTGYIESFDLGGSKFFPNFADL